MQGLLGALVEREPVVVRLELGDASGQREAGVVPSNGREHTGEEPFRIDAGGLGEEDGELVATGAVRDVGLPQRAAYERRGSAEQLVATQLAEPVVDDLEVVHVQHEQRQPPVIAVRTSHLPRERVVEAAAPGEPRDGVVVARGTCLAELSCGVDRRAGGGSDCLEAGQRIGRESWRGVVRVRGEETQRLAVCLEGHGDTRAQGTRRLIALAIHVGELDGARGAPIRRAGDHLPLGLVTRHTGRRDQHRPVEARRADHSRVDAAHRARSVRRARERLVEIERATEVAEGTGAQTVVVRPFDRDRELVRERVHAGADLAQRRGDPLLGLGVAPPAADGDEKHDGKRRQRGHERNDPDHHKRETPARTVGARAASCHPCALR